MGCSAPSASSTAVGAFAVSAAVTIPALAAACCAFSATPAAAATRSAHTSEGSATSPAATEARMLKGLPAHADKKQAFAAKGFQEKRRSPLLHLQGRSPARGFHSWLPWLRHNTQRHEEDEPLRILPKAGHSRYATAWRARPPPSPSKGSAA